jgi:hypothetical protein
MKKEKASNASAGEDDDEIKSFPAEPHRILAMLKRLCCGARPIDRSRRAPKPKMPKPKKES